jgi:serine phosphatase RsbU (regulator of sigma subunit)
MAHLFVLKGLNAKQSISLDKEKVLLGRNANCDIVFPPNDFAVSREHACILRVQNKFFIEDLGSRNGTFVNNQPVTARMALKDNDRIRICDFLYSFHEAAPAPKPPLPAEIRPEPTMMQDEVEENPNVEAAVSNTSSQMLLHSQPLEKLHALVDISTNLGKTLELNRLLPQIVESLFQLFKQADRCFIILREEAIERDKPVERLIPKVIKTRRSLDESQASYSRSIVRECLKTVQAFLSDDAATDKRFNMSQSIADFKIRSVMCAPLWTQDNKAFGVIQLDTQDRSKKFTQDDLKLLLAVASQASNALENARMHEDLLAQERLRRDVELAHQVQLSFLPKREPEVPGYEFFACYEPAQQVGGDYYGFIPLPPPQPRLAIMLGDVAGKGVPAALLMAKLSSDARICVLSEPTPAQTITALNDLLSTHTSEMDRFVTLVAAMLDYSTHTVDLVSAGHPVPCLIRHNATTAIDGTPKDVSGLPLGVMEGFPYESSQIRLEPGDSLLLFSDGVPDALDKQNKPFDYQKAINAALQEGVRSPKALGRRLLAAVKQHMLGRAPFDDITMVCFGRVAESSPAAASPVT